MDTPEKLMLRPTPEYGWDWPDPAADDDPDGLRYVRDDLHAAVIAERDNAVWERDENLRLLVKVTAKRDALAARVAVLEGALRRLYDEAMDNSETPYFKLAMCAARDALDDGLPTAADVRGILSPDANA